MLRRHITQGMMKYRGSTNGAVMRESVVVRRKMVAKAVVGPDGGRALAALPPLLAFFS